MHKCPSNKGFASCSEACTIVHSEYAVFLENEHKRELLEEGERKKREQAEIIQKAKEKTSSLHMNS